MIAIMPERSRSVTPLDKIKEEYDVDLDPQAAQPEDAGTADAYRRHVKSVLGGLHVDYRRAA
jgi:hypothetical protein